MGRKVTLVLVDGTGTVLGELPPFDLERPFWPETADVVATVRELYGIDVVILRILATERAQPHGGAVTYLAQTETQTGQLPPGLRPSTVTLGADPRRPAYAEINGPAKTLAWAETALGTPILARTQLRTWNLSTIWRLDTADGPVWLKQIPPFFAHESAVVRWIGPPLVPEVLAAENGKMLLADVPGEDLYGAGLELRRAVAEGFHRVQAAAVRDLPLFGVPDERGQALIEPIKQVVTEYGGDQRLIEDLPERFAEIEACGVPDTLVHGDLHPGNVRGDGQRWAIIDWGDSFVGHPGYDIMRLAEGLPEADRQVLIGEWAERWRNEVPGCEPERVLDLMAPLAHLRAAVVYARFVANIEPAEHPYHASDVPAALERAAAAA
jgi:Phosphotransferase enzyme family